MKELPANAAPAHARQMTPMAGTRGDTPAPLPRHARALAPRNREMMKVDAVIVKQSEHCRGKMNDSKRPLI
jgi:hypothetical protein